jgi:hypothetical protein
MLAAAARDGRDFSPDLVESGLPAAMPFAVELLIRDWREGQMGALTMGRNMLLHRLLLFLMALLFVAVMNIGGWR